MTCSTHFSRKHRTLTQTAIALLLLATHPITYAAEGSEESPFHVSGFATLAATHNDNANAGAISTTSQKYPARKGWSGNLDSVTGIQFDWQAAENTSFLLQGVARSGNEFSPELRMGYLRQQLGSEFSVRLGRIRSPLFLDSDVAEIGYAYLMTRPPLPIYSIANNVSSIDGGDLQWRHRFGNTVVLMQGFYGQNEYKHRFYNLDPVETVDASLHDIGGLGVTAFLPNVTLHATHTQVGSYTMRGNLISGLNNSLNQLATALRYIASDIPPAFGGTALRNQAQQIEKLYNVFDSKPIYSSIGFDANAGDWRFLGELIRFDSQSAIVGKYNGWQLTVGRSFENVTPYVSYATLRRSGSALDTSALSSNGFTDEGLAQLKAALDGASRYANLSMKSLSVGARYDFRENMALKAQFDHMETLNGNAAGYFAVSSLPNNRPVNLFTVSLDLVF